MPEREGPVLVRPDAYTVRWMVRGYELDLNGHVNNAVYLNWVEQVAADHVEALGFGRDWSLRHDGGWVIREHHITYHRPARYGDRLVITTIPLELGAVRGTRRTEVRREADDALLAEALTEWVWVRLSDGRPSRVPVELRAAFGSDRRGR